jgi:hypothetical protein
LSITEATLAGLETVGTNAYPEADVEAVPIDGEAAQVAVIRPPNELSAVDREILLTLSAQKETFPHQLLSDPLLCSHIAAETAYFAQELLRIFGDGKGGASGEPDTARKEAVIALLSRFGKEWKVMWRKAYEMLESGADFSKNIEACRKQVERNSYENELKRLDVELRAAQTDDERVAIAQERLSIQKLLQNYGVTKGG